MQGTFILFSVHRFTYNLSIILNCVCVCVRPWHRPKWQWLIECLTENTTPMSLCSQKCQGWTRHPLLGHVLGAEGQKTVRMCTYIKIIFTWPLKNVQFQNFYDIKPISLSWNKKYAFAATVKLHVGTQPSTSCSPSTSSGSISSFLSFLFLFSCTVLLAWRRSRARPFKWPNCSRRRHDLIYQV